MGATGILAELLTRVSGGMDEHARQIDHAIAGVQTLAQSVQLLSDDLYDVFSEEKLG